MDADGFLCPRDESPLARARGALLESICPRCQGRLFDAATTEAIVTERLHIAPDVFRTLMSEGGRGARCPSCSHGMSIFQLRGVTVDACRGCGSLWLDEKELTRLLKDTVREVRVEDAIVEEAIPQEPDSVEAPVDTPIDTIGASGLELDWSGRGRGSERYYITLRCYECSREMSITENNWLIRGMPYCTRCAETRGFVVGIRGDLMSAAESFLERVSTLIDGSLPPTETCLVRPADSATVFAQFLTLESMSRPP